MLLKASLFTAAEQKSGWHRMLKMLKCALKDFQEWCWQLTVGGGGKLGLQKAPTPVGGQKLPSEHLANRLLHVLVLVLAEEMVSSFLPP